MTKLTEGVVVSMGGREWTVPALTLGQVKRLLPDIAALSAGGDVLTPELANAVVKIVHGALLRNYPDVTHDQVEDMIDLRNFRVVIDAIMGISGLIAAPGEAAGETSR